MNAEQINIAIAESLGWTQVRRPDNQMVWCQPRGIFQMETTLPNYHGDLNACAEMERKGLVTDQEIEDYLEALNEALEADVPKGSPSFTAYFATAPQRCEAYLKTKGLWK